MDRWWITKLSLCLGSSWKTSISPLSRSSSSSSSSSVSTPSEGLWARRDLEKRVDSGLSSLGESSYRPSSLTSSLCMCAHTFIYFIHKCIRLHDTYHQFKCVWKCDINIVQPITCFETKRYFDLTSLKRAQMIGWMKI